MGDSVRVEGTFDFLDKDDSETGKGDQDQDHGSRAPTQPVKKMDDFLTSTQEDLLKKNRKIASKLW